MMPPTRCAGKRPSRLGQYGSGDLYCDKDVTGAARDGISLHFAVISPAPTTREPKRSARAKSNG
jgi:hypothetical protein